jgi:hypothetical protein
MNFNVGNLVLVRIEGHPVRARIVEFISNNNILLELIGAAYYGQQIISASSTDIIRVLDDQKIHNSNLTNINSIIPTSLSHIHEFDDNHIRNGGKKSRRNSLHLFTFQTPIFTIELIFSKISIHSLLL